MRKAPGVFSTVKRAPMLRLALPLVLGLVFGRVVDPSPGVAVPLWVALAVLWSTLTLDRVGYAGRWWRGAGAMLVWCVLVKDVVEAFIWDGQFGMGLGTLVMMVNTTLLGLYTFSCHSFRHLIGGKHDCWSCLTFGKQRHALWQGVSWLNKRHMQFAWASLFSVALTDVYIRLCAMDYLQDMRIF